MPKFTLKKGGRLRHDGALYTEGQQVEMTAEQAKAVAHVLVPPAKPEEKPAPKPADDKQPTK